MIGGQHGRPQLGSQVRHRRAEIGGQDGLPGGTAGHLTRPASSESIGYDEAPALGYLPAWVCRHIAAKPILIAWPWLLLRVIAQPEIAGSQLCSYASHYLPLMSTVSWSPGQTLLFPGAEATGDVDQLLGIAAISVHHPDSPAAASI